MMKRKLDKVSGGIQRGQILAGDANVIDLEIGTSVNTPLKLKGNLTIVDNSQYTEGRYADQSYIASSITTETSKRLW